MSGLITCPEQLWLAVAPVDMRRGLDSLSAIVQQRLGHSPCAGSAFIFRNRSGNRLRLLLWAGNGVWLWQWVVAGVDWQRLSAQPVAAAAKDPKTFIIKHLLLVLAFFSESTL